MSINSLVNTHTIIPSSEIYGPGVRWVLWTQGCSLGCKGCWNTETWDPSNGKLLSLIELKKSIDDADGVEGITLLGGEPLQQASVMLELIRYAKGKDLSVMLYTGYYEKEFDETMKQCFELSDLVIQGRYVEEKRDLGLLWRGSTNQIIESPTGYYDVEQFEEAQEVEIHIDHDSGQVTVTGYPDADIIEMVEGLSNSKIPFKI
jgi:anaerobic ribonucleoside-triphosphate reductase activating protein